MILENRPHDYEHLIRRWRRAAAAAGLRMRKYSESGAYGLFLLESSSPPATAPSIYLSAGIHGDEAAATEGLLLWAERNARTIRRTRALVFPCLNPWGLVNNSRLDAGGRDLNRCYGRRRPPQVRDHIRAIGKTRFDVALTLHEDYDADGVYIYEVAAQKPYWAERMLSAASRHIPPDSRKRIEGRPAKGGIVRRSITPDLMPDWPEAFLLHFSHAARTFTIETPSELDISRRVAAHAAVLDAALSACLASR